MDVTYSRGRVNKINKSQRELRMTVQHLSDGQMCWALCHRLPCQQLNQSLYTQLPTDDTDILEAHTRLQIHGRQSQNCMLKDNAAKLTKSQDTLGFVPANEMTCDTWRCRLRAAGRTARWINAKNCRAVTKSSLLTSSCHR